MRKKEPSFEEALHTLEEIVEELEGENLSLSDSLAVFEKGINLSRMCVKKLEEAEKKIEILLEENSLATKPFVLAEKGEA